ncbi:MAG: hypothetical protein IPK75_18855 [Acidobacteria bacterium]|nr:hypothetical protein [Acidobacteriota bacterium]
MIAKMLSDPTSWNGLGVGSIGGLLITAALAIPDTFTAFGLAASELTIIGVLVGGLLVVAGALGIGIKGASGTLQDKHAAEIAELKQAAGIADQPAGTATPSDRGKGVVSLVLALVIALSGLAACATTDTPALSPKQQLFVLRSDYGSALQSIATYEARPRCTETFVLDCSDPSVVTALRRVAGSTRAALDAAQVIIMDPGIPPAVADQQLTVVRSALAALRGELVRGASK